jgi:menaquinone-dependent protoporphyrinogen oxidase
MNVWVIVASKYGSTREIGDAIAEELRAHGHEVEVKDAAGVEDLDEPDVIILGSAIYAGRWLKEARQLVEQRAGELAARPTWLFSSGPIGDPPKPEEAEPEGISDAIAATSARDHEIFAGKLDYSALNRFERLLVKALKAPEGDFRDWETIRKWANTLSTQLTRRV